jgi:hypothetical protein
LPRIYAPAVQQEQRITSAAESAACPNFSSLLGDGLGRPLASLLTPGQCGAPVKLKVSIELTSFG